MPWEVCIALANFSGKDLWLNIPAHATDDYILQLATLLLASVDPSLFIYYEYSNEVWNWVGFFLSLRGFPFFPSHASLSTSPQEFEQADYNLNEANRSVVQDGDPNLLNYDHCNNAGYWAWRRTAFMCKHVADIFKTVFGDDGVGSGKRVRPILSGQVSSPEPIRQGLVYTETVWGPPSRFFHAIAGAPYFGLPAKINNDPNLTVEGVFEGFDQSIAAQSVTAGVDVRNPLAVHVALAYHYGLQMRAYEGGPDTAGPNLGPAYLKVKGDASVDPRIQARVETYLTSWYQYGAAMGPLNYFVAGATPLIDQWGVYGILFDMRVQDGPKARGVDAIRVLPRPSTPTSAIPQVPFTANCTRDRVGAPFPVQPPYYCAYFGANETFDFFLQHTDATPSQKLSVVVRVGTPWKNATLGVQLNDGQEALVACPTSPAGWTGTVPCEAAVFDAPQGVALVRLRSIGAYSAYRTYNIFDITFSLLNE